MDKIKLNRIIYLHIILFYSCNAFHPTPLDDAYALAGDHVVELKKVVAHFEKDKGLGEQADAARYIVENMPGHSNMDDANYLAYSKLLKTLPMPKEGKQLDSLWHAADIHYAQDVTNIESIFLIQDIEDAFRIRDSVPWGKVLPFDVFKEHVLPYKVRGEALMPNWRMTLYHRYKHVIEGITDPEEAFAALLTYLKEHSKKTSFNFSGDIDPLTMDYIKTGSCSHLCIYYVAVLRALGLPAAYEYIDRWGNFSLNGHSWVSYVGEKGATYTLANGDSVLKTMNPIDASTFRAHYDPHHPDFQVDKWKKVYKIYRYSYPLHYGNRYAPQEQRKTHIQDVSSQYGLTGAIDLDASGQAYASLSVFRTGDDWREFVFAQAEGGKISFDGLGDSILYLPVFYKSGGEKKIGKTFFIDAFQKITWVETGASQKNTLVVRRKYPLFGT